MAKESSSDERIHYQRRREEKLANRIKDLCESRDRFDMLVGYFYFSAIGSIAEEKMFAIHGILGEDAQMFSSEEEPTAAGLYNKLCSLDDEDELSFYTKVKGEYEKSMAYDEDFFREKKTKQRKLEIIATIQRV